MREFELARLMRLALLPAVALGVSMSAWAQTDATAKSARANAAATPAAPQIDYRGVRASEIIGMSVRNRKDENIGQIGDLIINMKTGEVRYAILRFDPGFLQSEEMFAVPTTRLRIAPDRNDVVFGVPESRLENAALTFELDNGPLDPQRMKDLDKLWEMKMPAGGVLAYRASDLIGKDVNSLASGEIGEIEELIINMATQQVHYAVLAFDPGWAASETNYAVPLTAFDMTIDQDELVLDIDKPRVQAMKSFPDSRYTNLDDRSWVSGIDRNFVTVFPKAGTASPARSADNPGAPRR